MRFLLQVGPFRFELAFDVARLDDVQPLDSTVARLDKARI